MQPPLQVRMKREAHRRIAAAQDIIVGAVLSVFDTAVLHGGTAIWRCYGGRRFSDDLDFYLPRDSAKLDLLFGRLSAAGFAVRKRKVGERSVYSELELDRVSVRLEATFQRAKGVLCDYETVEGNRITIYSLSPEAFLAEKALTYAKRRKVRDLWDLFFLAGRVGDISKVAGMGPLLKDYLPPVDGPDLKAIILEGIVPTADAMIDYLRRKWENRSI